MSSYNFNGFVSPEGKTIEADQMYHAECAWRNRHLVGYDGAKSSEAISAFMVAGWVRVMKHNGVSVNRLHEGNIGLVKRILRDMAKDNKTSTVYLDVENFEERSTYRVPVLMTGRADFSNLPSFGEDSGKHRYQG